MKNYQIRSQVLTIANLLKQQGWSFSQAQKQAWNVVRCQEAMRRDEIVIRFRKDGEEIPEQRTATLSPAFFNYQSTSTKTRKENPLQVCFFDTVKQNFRSFNVSRFVGFEAAPLMF